MKIGIDIDDTICCTKEAIELYSKIFIKDNNISTEQFWNTEEYKNEFLSEYLEKIYLNAKIKNNCVDTINKLKESNELFLITARTNNYVSDIIKIIKDYLMKHNINIDPNNIFINANDKVKECIKNGIDVMIEDSFYNYNRLMKNNIKVLLFDENKKYLDVNNRFEKWNELEQIINKID